MNTTEPCTNGCNHTDAEHRATGIAQREAWLTGYSVGVLNVEAL